jgi:hypothetical protein
MKKLAARDFEDLLQVIASILLSNHAEPISSVLFLLLMVYSTVNIIVVS